MDWVIHLRFTKSADLAALPFEPTIQRQPVCLLACSPTWALVFGPGSARYT